MSGAHRRTITIRWQTLAAAVPVAVLVASGLAVAQSNDSSPTAGQVAAPAVPQQAVTQPDRLGTALEPVAGGSAPAPDPAVAPGLSLPPGTSGGSSQPVRLDGPGIPAPALAAYRLAAGLLARADAPCGIDWALVGAIGRVESNHARFGGNALDSSGVARPGIIGLPLNGSNGTALIRDSDNGRWDRDTTYDRAVGPMQFIPGTWRSVGSDADGDGVKNPQDMNDAATATAVYLCSGPGDLRQSRHLYSAIRRYNNSDSYVRTVIAIADAYRRGVTTLPASSLPAAHPASSGGDGGGTVLAGGGERAATAPRTSAAPGGSRTGSGSTPGASGGATKPSASTSGGAVPHTEATSASDPAAPLTSAASSAASHASSAASSVVSVVTSLVTSVVKLPTPSVTTTEHCVLNVLGVRVCTQVPTTIKSTTTTRTSTTTITRRK